MRKAAVSIRIEPELKTKAEAILRKIGLTPSEAIRLFYKQVCLNRRLPFDVKTPSIKETAYLLRSPANAKNLRESIKQYEQGKCHKRDLIED